MIATRRQADRCMQTAPSARRFAELHLSDHALSANETSWVPALRNALLDRAVAVSERTGTLIGGAIGIMIGAMV